MLYRHIYDDIKKFYQDHDNMALLITGARQVGKSYIIDRYGEAEYKSYIKLNFIENPDYISLFDGVSGAEEVIVRMSAEFGDRMITGETLIFFDEVQECIELVTLIKFLVQRGDYKYILSGSLLGTILKEIRSIPVGYMATYQMYPMDLKEFAIANGVGQKTIDSLHDAFVQRTPVDEYVHKRMMELFELYMIIGGMPQAVSTYVETNNLGLVEAIQNEILELYREDIAKYDAEEKLYLREIFDIIPSEINAKNKRFVLKNLNEYTKFTKYNNSFLWLKNAGVALPVYTAKEPTYPLTISKSTNLFKLFMNDVGLLTAMYGEGLQIKILKHETAINFGAMFENAVAQELASHGFDLYYYNNKKRGEVDFLIGKGDRIIPIEVKSGKDYYRHAALDNLLDADEYSIEEGFVLCGNNVEKLGKTTYLPVYMIMFIEPEKLPNDLIHKVDFSDLP